MTATIETTETTTQDQAQATLAASIRELFLLDARTTNASGDAYQAMVSLASVSSDVDTFIIASKAATATVQAALIKDGRLDAANKHKGAFATIRSHRSTVSKAMAAGVSLDQGRNELIAATKTAVAEQAATDEAAKVAAMTPAELASVAMSDAAKLDEACQKAVAALVKQYGIGLVNKAVSIAQPVTMTPPAKVAAG